MPEASRYTTNGGLHFTHFTGLPGMVSTGAAEGQCEVRQGPVGGSARGGQVHMVPRSQEAVQKTTLDSLFSNRERGQPPML